MKLQKSWNLQLVLKNDSEKEILSLRKVCQKETDVFVRRWKNRVDYLSDPAVLAGALAGYERYRRFFAGNGAERYYFYLASSLDQTDPKIKARFNQAVELGNRSKNEVQFFELNLSKIPKSIQQKFLQEPKLAEYRHFLEKLFGWGNHLLSDPEEKIMNLKRTPAYDNWVRMVEEFLSREETMVLMENGKKEKQNFSRLAGLMDSQNKRTRDSAARGFNAILVKYLDIAEQEINSILADKKIDDELRKFLEAEEERLLADDIEREAVDSLVMVVSGANHLSAKYYELKAKLFGVKKLAYHERNVLYGNLEQGYPFEQAAELVDSVLAKLHPELSKIFRAFLENGQVDVYPAKGKSGGAFCTHDMISLPTFILLNHNDRLRDVTTLAHEMGHGINNELTRVKQNALNFDSPTSTAEVASTFMEDFVFEKLLVQADDELELQLLMAKLGDDVGTIFRQIAFYEFERELHSTFRSRGYLTAREIGQLFARHTRAYMGDFVEQSDGSANWWVYVSHFRYFFYVYSYASGLLISKYLQGQVRKNPRFIDSVVEFLSSGTSASPKETFAKMGIKMDTEFWKQGVREFSDLLDQAWSLARKLGKI